MQNTASRDLLIAFSLLPFLTPNRTRLLRETFDPLETACNASSRLLQDLLSLNPAQADEVKNPLTRQRLAQVAALRENAVTLADPTYSPLLREIIDPPLALFVRGDISLLARPCIALVGSRRASPYAINAGELLARQLAPAGLTVVSGLARGVDAACHAAALDAGGSTIAVLGTGIDVVYPRSNSRLFERIAAEGLIVSEFPPGTPPKPEHFPIRNRIISGLSLGAVVVEATVRSGSLITARMAAEQGREVFAVPGSIFSEKAEGSHRLIQYGAKLVHDARDVVDELQGNFQLERDAQASPREGDRELLNLLSCEEGMHIDTLTAQLQRDASLLAESLLRLELDGWIRALPGARFVRTRTLPG